MIFYQTINDLKEYFAVWQCIRDKTFILSVYVAKEIKFLFSQNFKWGYFAFNNCVKQWNSIIFKHKTHVLDSCALSVIFKVEWKSLFPVETLIKLKLTRIQVLLKNLVILI